jgi:branched-chain amino acid transport system ATP-binding protein
MSADETRPLLQVQGLRKAFGAVQATQGVDLALQPGELHALIGPNGAGKSTLIGQLCGEIRPDAGRIHWDGRDITAWPAHRRARAGLGRSFQITQLCPEFTALENVLLALVLRGGARAWLPWPDPRRDRRQTDEARHWLAEVGLAGQAARRVADLAHGEKRQLELAVALARQPRLLLLDEPMAGTGPEESARMTELLRGLKRRYTLLLVEHDMDAVFALADRITVLVYGRTIFTGTPDEVRAHPQVRAAYLGNDAQDEGPAAMTGPRPPATGLRPLQPLQPGGAAC